jgi:hypothetical protein
LHILLRSRRRRTSSSTRRRGSSTGSCRSGSGGLPSLWRRFGLRRLRLWLHSTNHRRSARRSTRLCWSNSLNLSKIGLCVECKILSSRGSVLRIIASRLEFFDLDGHDRVNL